MEDDFKIKEIASDYGAKRSLEHPDESLDEFDVDVRLIPPPMPEWRIKVKVRFIGEEPPRIFFDPDRD